MPIIHSAGWDLASSLNSKFSDIRYFLHNRLKYSNGPHSIFQLIGKRLEWVYMNAKFHANVVFLVERKGRLAYCLYDVMSLVQP